MVLTGDTLLTYSWLWSRLCTHCAISNVQEEELWCRGAKNSIALWHGVQPAVGVDFLSRGGSATDIKAYTKTRISTERPHEHAYF
jgi:hypothetical protein